MTQRDVTAELRNDVLVDIPRTNQRRFGTAGKMLKPSVTSVAEAVSQVPRGTVIPITELRWRLASTHGAQTTCPFLTKRALILIAEDPNATAPYWRVVPRERRDDRLLSWRGGRGGEASQGRKQIASSAHARNFNPEIDGILKLRRRAMFTDSRACREVNSAAP
jgi:hypothetical protein